jgi:hypothetical protein
MYQRIAFCLFMSTGLTANAQMINLRVTRDGDLIIY